LTDSLTDRYASKYEAKYLLTIAPRLESVATLPCEASISEN